MARAWQRPGQGGSSAGSSKGTRPTSLHRSNQGPRGCSWGAVVEAGASVGDADQDSAQGHPVP